MNFEGCGGRGRGDQLFGPMESGTRLRVGKDWVGVGG